MDKLDNPDTQFSVCTTLCPRSSDIKWVNTSWTDVTTYLATLDHIHSLVHGFVAEGQTDLERICYSVT